MIYHLVQTIIEPGDPTPKTKVFVLQGDTMQDILSKIDAHPQHKANLKRYKKTSFRTPDGVVHQWFLKEIIGPN
jgi:hypothetical protein